MLIYSAKTGKWNSYYLPLIILNIIEEDGPKFISFLGLTVEVKFTSGLSSRNRICVVVV